MNLPTDPNELPPPFAAPQGDPWPQRPQLAPRSKRPPFKLIGIAAAVLIGFAVIGAASKDDDKSSTSVSTADIDQTALEIAWDGSSADDRASMCGGYNLAPDLMWNSFNEAAERQMSRATWERFFDAHC